MLREIKLQGKLKKYYPEGADSIKLDVDTVAEAIRGLSHQLPGFKEDLREGHYRIYLGDPSKDFSIDSDGLNFNIGSTDIICIQPVLEGSGDGAGKVVAGIALVALSFAVPAAAVGYASATAGGVFGAGIVTSSVVAKIGIAVALGGVSQLLTPDIKPPDASTFEKAGERPSFIFNGPVNNTEQGGPVPLVYGKIRTGSIVISAGLYLENI